MGCQDFAIALSRPLNKRFEAAGARRLRNESFFSAPQLKRDPLGCTIRMRAASVAIVLAFLSASCSGARSAPVGARSGPPVTLLDGNWELNLARTHYGRGVDRRRREVFTCGPRGELVHCVIRSVRTDGRVVVGEFGATLDGVGARVSGVAGVDEGQLNQSTDSV